jgi:galactokinase
LDAFLATFGQPPLAVGCAPGRVNLLGEHTDYNDGYVLPIAIAQQTCVSIRPNGGTEFRLHAAALGAAASFSLEPSPPQQFARYVHGCIALVVRAGFDVPVLDLHVASDVPIGVGLSSSAALEVATLRALRTLLALPIDDIGIARIAQQAEIEFAGVRCGIMDQMAASLGNAATALLLDTRTLDHRPVPLPADAAVLVLDSGIARTLAGSTYNERRRECEQAAALLGVAALRDLDLFDLERIASLPAPLAQRARHVVTENARVLQAGAGIDAATFGGLMNASHASLRDDFEVSLPALDRLVGLLQRNRDVYGARLTGAGFGGACVALCAVGRQRQVADAVLADYAHGGGHGRLLVPAAENRELIPPPAARATC